jgi:hypothetical protein
VASQLYTLQCLSEDAIETIEQTAQTRNAIDELHMHTEAMLPKVGNLLALQGRATSSSEAPLTQSMCLPAETPGLIDVGSQECVHSSQPGDPDDPGILDGFVGLVDSAPDGGDGASIGTGTGTGTGIGDDCSWQTFQAASVAVSIPDDLSLGCAVGCAVGCAGSGLDADAVSGEGREDGGISDTGYQACSGTVSSGNAADEATSEPHMPTACIPAEPLYYPLSQLVQPGPFPDGIDIACREKHLSDADFGQAFGMTRTQYHALPQWKRNQKKRQLKLF